MADGPNQTGSNDGMSFQPYVPPGGSVPPGGPGQPYPGPGGPQGGVPLPPPVPPAAQRSGCRKAFLIGFVVMALLLGGCGVLGYVGFRSVKGAADEGNRFLSALNKGAAEAAARACKGTGLDASTLGEVRDYLTENKWDGSKNLRSSNVRSLNGRTTGEVTGTIRLDGADRQISLVMEKHGGWCVSGLHLGAADSGASVGDSAPADDDSSVSETTALR